jgi:hypothetical protein
MVLGPSRICIRVQYRQVPREHLSVGIPLQLCYQADCLCSRTRGLWGCIKGLLAVVARVGLGMPRIGRICLLMLLTLQTQPWRKVPQVHGVVPAHQEGHGRLRTRRWAQRLRHGFTRGRLEPSLVSPEKEKSECCIRLTHLIASITSTDLASGHQTQGNVKSLAIIVTLLLSGHGGCNGWR